MQRVGVIILSGLTVVLFSGWLGRRLYGYRVPRLGIWRVGYTRFDEMKEHAEGRIDEATEVAQ